MDYGRLLRDAWTITWRHRFLWLFGLFAGSSAGSCASPSANFSFPGQWNTSSRELSDGASSPNLEPVTGWIGENGGLIIALVLMVVVVIFLVWALFKVLSLIAQGGMVKATADTGAGLPGSPRQALQSGLNYFWRFLGLWLLQIAVSIVAAILIAIIVMMFVVTINVVPESLRFVPIILGVLFGIVAIFALIPVSILFSIVVAFAQRAMVIENVGPVAAVKAGISLLRSRLRSSLLLWLICVAINILAGLIMLVAMVVTVAPLAIIGIVLNIAIGFGGPLVVYIILAAIVLVVVLWSLSAIVSTFFWTYWTLAYLRLTGREMTA